MSLAIGWLIPGGAYLVKKRYNQFALCFVLVLTAFIAGVALGGLSTPPQPGFFGVASRLAEWLAGAPCLIAEFFRDTALPANAPPHDAGLALLIAAGVINLLALGDRD